MRIQFLSAATNTQLGHMMYSFKALATVLTCKLSLEYDMKYRV